jgi:hypothetical protein
VDLGDRYFLIFILLTVILKLKEVQNMKAIEVTGTVDEKHRLLLDGPVPINGPSKVRVIILMNEETDIDEKEWLHAAAVNPAFDFLRHGPEKRYLRLNDNKVQFFKKHKNIVSKTFFNFSQLFLLNSYT